MSDAEITRYALTKFLIAPFAVGALILLVRRAAPPWWAAYMGLILAAPYLVLSWNAPSLAPGFHSDFVFQGAYVNRMIQGGWLTDYYYQGLSIYYPPLFFWWSGLLGKVAHLDALMALRYATVIALLVTPWIVYLSARAISSDRGAQGIAIVVVSLVGVPYTFLLIKPWEWMASVGTIGWMVASINYLTASRRSVTWGLILGGLGGVIYLANPLPLLLGGSIVLLWLLLHFRRKSAGGRLLLLASGASIVASPFWVSQILNTAKAPGSPPAFAFFDPLWHLRLFFEILPPSYGGILLLLGLIYLVIRWQHPPLRSLAYLTAVSLAGYAVLTFLIGVFHWSTVFSGKVREIQPVLSFSAAIALSEGYGLLAPHLGGLRLSAGPKVALAAAGLLLALPFTPLFHYADDNLDPGRAWRAAFVPVDQRVYETATLIKEWRAEKGRVPVLLNVTEPRLDTFAPVYEFISFQEAYSNPAARFRERLQYVESLPQRASDQDLWQSLRATPWGPIDGLLVSTGEDGAYYLEIYSLGSFGRHMTTRVRFPSSLFKEPWFTLAYQDKGIALIFLKEASPPTSALPNNVPLL